MAVIFLLQQLVTNYATHTLLAPYTNPDVTHYHELNQCRHKQPTIRAALHLHAQICSPPRLALAFALTQRSSQAWCATVKIIHVRARPVFDRRMSRRAMCVALFMSIVGFLRRRGPTVLQRAAMRVAFFRMILALGARPGAGWPVLSATYYHDQSRTEDLPALCLSGNATVPKKTSPLTRQRSNLSRRPSSLRGGVSM
jgi:lysylphosphatidylglycerol synthetase-like protein (DUF2156 family)